MEQRISLITLAVDDLPRAVQFYENMGWQAAQTGPGVAAFNMIGTVFGLYLWDSMAKDMGLDPKSAMRPRMTFGLQCPRKGRGCPDSKACRITRRVNFETGA